MTAEIVGLILFAYALGAIPFGVLMARRYGVDIRKVGSGNTGATNVWRAIGPKAGAPVFLLDVLKGLIPCLAARQLGLAQEIVFGIGVAAVLGHCLSPFLGFKGGKGIATTLGVVLGTSPLVALSGFGVFLAMMALTQFVSLSSILGVLSAIGFGVLYHDRPMLVGAYSLLALFVIYRHRANVKRLMTGSEPKFKFRKTPQPAETSNHNMDAEEERHPTQSR